MARRRKGPNLNAIQKAATRAAAVLTPRRPDPPVHHPDFVYPRPKAIRPSPVLKASPRQIRLDHPARQHAIQALEIAGGKPIGRRTRAKLQGLIPQVVYDTLCKRKRKRREVMFAKGSAGKNKTVAARRPRKNIIGKC